MAETNKNRSSSSEQSDRGTGSSEDVQSRPSRDLDDLERTKERVKEKVDDITRRASERERERDLRERGGEERDTTRQGGRKETGEEQRSRESGTGGGGFPRSPERERESGGRSDVDRSKM